VKKECTSVADHFDGHASAFEQNRRHCPMRHVQGYPGSHWMPPLGNYSLCIPPAAARATANETMTKTYTYSAGHFDGRGNVPIRYGAHRRWRRSRAPLEATGRRHRASIAANSSNRSRIHRVFVLFFMVDLLKKSIR
jgi:hypothetical protein